MFIKQLYTACLSEATYYIESNGLAAIVDPLRDTRQYIQLAQERNTRIVYILETHFHADFVSGHLDLAKETGATIIYGPHAVTPTPVKIAQDNEIIRLGDIFLKVLHTPGHTIESCCYLLHDKTGNPHCIFTGDTLFVGDVGRPDLSSGNLSTEELASMMFDTIHNKILPLADDIIVYPGHGAGSSCGKNLGKESYSTIGEQKKSNYALRPQSREEFITSVVTGLDVAPKYFSLNAKINQQGYEPLTEILSSGLTPLCIDNFSGRMKEDTIILDTRPGTTFVQGFIPGSIFIGLEGRFAEWAALLLPFDKPILFISEKGKEEETVIRLARVGFNKIEGYLEGGFEAWMQAGLEIDMIIDIEPDELAMDIPFDDNLITIDVRKEPEFAEAHIENATNLPLAELTDIVSIAGFEDTQNLYIHCAAGYRSIIACSLFKRQGLHNIRNVNGGWKRIINEGRIRKINGK